jgi:zinc transporter ZupT
VKFTGSTKDAVNLALYGPPLLMLLASGLGAAIGATVQAIPIIFVAMVSFGAVALLFLVCNELLIEAREAQGDDEKWFISIMVFVGIYLVLMLDHIL